MQPIMTAPASACSERPSPARAPHWRDTARTWTGNALGLVAAVLWAHFLAQGILIDQRLQHEAQATVGLAHADARTLPDTAVQARHLAQP